MKKGAFPVIKLWMLCIYFPGAAVVTLVCYRTGMPLTLPIAFFSAYGGVFTAWYLLERWKKNEKRKTRHESQPLA